MSEKQLDSTIQEKITKARMRLWNLCPFFSMLALHFGNAKPVTFLSTAAVTGNGDFLLNEEFAARLSISDMTFVIAHEVMHLVTKTAGESRLPEANRTLSNIASDCVINYMLCHPEHGAGIPILDPDIGMAIYGHYPSNAMDKLPVVRDHDGKIVPPRDWSKYDGWTYEQVYFDLYEELSEDLKDKLNQSGGYSEEGTGEGQAPFEGWWWDDSAERLKGKGTEDPDNVDEDGNQINEEMTEEQRREWCQRVQNAAAVARGCGKLPGVLDKFCTDILKPEYNWKSELRRIAQRDLRTRYTWKRPSRRTCNTVRTPGRSPDAPSAVLYMDTSGSMSDDDLRRCISEMYEIVKLCGGKCWLILGDVVVYYSGDVDLDALKRLPVHRGGTDFRPVFQAIEESDRPKPQLFIGFTDCGGPFPARQPDFPIVWCVPGGHGTPPWGKKIKVTL
jgi:predicted metal-dependent peptidase